MAWSEHSVVEKMTYLHCKVSIAAGDKTYAGWIYTIDPVTHSVVLCENDRLITILGHGISRVSIEEIATKQMKEKLKKLLEVRSTTSDPEELAHKKSEVISWLIKNRFPVEAKEDIISVANVLEIVPPYTVNCCRTTNEIILSKIQKLLEAMPTPQ